MAAVRFPKPLVACCLALAGAACAGGGSEVDAFDPFADPGESERDVGVSCSGLNLCPSGGDTWSSTYRIGATVTSKGEYLQFFTSNATGSPRLLRLRLRPLRAFTNAATKVHAEILALSSAADPLDVAGATVLASASVSAVSLGSGDTAFDFTQGGTVTPPNLQNGSEYALFLTTDDVTAEDGSLLVGVGALSTFDYTGDARRRSLRAATPGNYGESRFRPAGTFDVAFGLKLAIDECTLGLDDCDTNATCTDALEGFSCACDEGYAGTGQSCTAVDPCTETPGLCGSGTCQFTGPGAYACNCPLGTAFANGTCEARDVVLGGDGVRSWSDGTFAKSCEGYRNPPAPYIYGGNIGSGSYRLDPLANGTLTVAYCDMSTTTGWTLAAKIQSGSGSAWKYDSTHWTSTGTLNPTDLTLNAGEAKYGAFNLVAFDQIRLVDQATSRKVVLPKGASSLQWLFANTAPPGINEAASGNGGVPENPPETTVKPTVYDSNAFGVIYSANPFTICNPANLSTNTDVGFNGAGSYKSDSGTARGKVRIGVWHSGSNSHYWSQTADCGFGIGVRTSGYGGTVESGTTVGAFTTVWVRGTP